MLDPCEPIAVAPDLEGYDARLREDGSFEVELARSSSVNELFAALDAQGVRVRSMRNKANRLEELFLRLVDSNEGDEVAS